MERPFRRAVPGNNCQAIVHGERGARHLRYDLTDLCRGPSPQREPLQDPSEHRRPPVGRFDVSNPWPIGAA